MRTYHSALRRLWRPAVLAGAMLPIFATAALAGEQEIGIFKEAVAAYQQGHFDSSTVEFLRLARGGVDDAAVWYNLGNAHFKSGRIGASLVSYQRGLRLTPRDPDLIANYRYVRLFAVDKIDPAGVFFLEKWWLALVNRLSFGEARLFAALAMWVAVLLTAGRVWPGLGRRVALWIVVAAWCLWLAATGASATRYFQDVVHRTGAVVAVTTDVRGGPGPDYTLQFVAHDGLTGSVERTESGWHLVRFPNGLKGWIAVSDFEVA